MMKSYRFRMCPTEEQAQLMWETIGSARFVYNQILSDRNFYHELFEDGILTKEERNTLQVNSTPGFYKNLTTDESLDYYGKGSFGFLKNVDSLALSNAQLNAEKAYKNFFQKRNGYPKFKSKDKAKWAYKTNVVSRRRKNGTYGANLYIRDDYVNLPKVGLVKINKHRAVYGRLKSATITKERSGYWFVSLLFDDSYSEYYEPTKSIVGVDLNIGSIVLSDGKEYEVPNFTKMNASDLAKAQRRFSRSQRALKARRSNGEGINKYQVKNYQENREKVALVHARIAAQRLDFLNKVTTEIVKNHDIISVETLRVKNLLKNKKLAKSISNASWGAFVSMLEQKCRSHGKILVKVDTYFASTQICSDCGVKGGPSGYGGLKTREWVCSNCGVLHNRDVNAAVNVRDEGLRIFFSQLGKRREEPPVVNVLGSSLDDDSRGHTMDEQSLALLGCPSRSDWDKKIKNNQFV